MINQKYITAYRKELDRVVTERSEKLFDSIMKALDNERTSCYHIDV